MPVARILLGVVLRREFLVLQLPTADQLQERIPVDIRVLAVVVLSLDFGEVRPKVLLAHLVILTSS